MSKIVWISIMVMASTVGFSLSDPRPESGSPVESAGWQRVYDASQGLDVVILLKEPSAAQKVLTLKGKGINPSKAAIMDLRKRQEDQQGRVIKRLALRGLLSKQGRRFGFLLNGFAAKVRPGDLDAIRSLPEVARVETDEQVTAHAGEVIESVKEINAPEVWTQSDASGQPLIGTGIRIAIIDTGIDYTHPDLGGGFGPGHRVTLGYDFANDDDDPMDDHGHGTHVAGIAAANGTVVGVAPGATLYAFKAIDNSGFGFESDVVAAIEMAVDPDGDPSSDDGAHVINLSLGGLGSVASPSALAADLASLTGAVVVASAGNDGNLGRVATPALAPRAIAVGSAKGPVVSSFSSCNSVPASVFKPEIAAPGEGVWSTVLGGAHDYHSGTSMSAPHIAGAAALIRQLHPDWDPARVKRFLINRTDHTNPETLNCMGAGLVNLAYVDDPLSLEMDVPGAWYGHLDLDATTSQATGEVRIYNVSDVPQTVTPMQAQIYGVSFEPGQPVTIQPGASATLSQTLVFDNAAWSFSPESDGLSVISSGIESQDRVLPFLHMFRKAYTLRLASAFGMWHDAVVFPESGTRFRYQPIGPTEEFEFYLGPGTYTVLSTEITFDGRQPSLWVKTEEVTFAEGLPSTHFLDTREHDAFSPMALTITDLDGSQLDLEHHQSFEILNFNWNNWIGFNYVFHGYTTPNYAFDRKAGLVINRNGYIKRPGRDEYLGFNWFSNETGTAPLHVAVNLVDTKPMSWSYLGDGINESHWPINLAVVGLQAYALLLPDFFPSGPGPYRFKTWEQIYPDLEELDPRQNVGRALVHPYSNDLSSLVVPTSQNTLSELELRPSGLHATGEINTHELSVGRLACAPMIAFATIEENAYLIPVGDPKPLADGLRNRMGDSEMQATLLLPDGSQRFANDPLELLRDLGRPPLGDYIFQINYHSRLRGEAVPSLYRQRFTLTEGADLDPVYFRRFALIRDEMIVETVTGRESMILELEGPVPDMLEIWFDRGEGWEPTSFSPTETTNRYQVSVPPPTLGRTMGLRILATGPGATEIELSIPRAFHTGYSRQLPWVVANDLFTSRVALVNVGEDPAVVTLIARDQEGREESRSLTLPGSTVQSYDAAELFAMNGYNLTVIATEDTVYPSFLTLTQRVGQAPTPAQTAGVSLRTPSANLSFGNLEGDQIPAIVLSAPFKADPDEVTPVLLEYVPRSMPPRYALIELTGARPFARTLSELFPDEPLAEDGWLKAKSLDETRIVGTLFGFNEAREASMSGASGYFRTPGDLVLPWLVANDTWNSEISIFNHNPYREALLTLKARTDMGQTFSRDMVLQSREVRTIPVEELFPGLTRFTLTIREDGANITAGLRTSNTTTLSGNSPARVSATQGHDTSQRILFGYLAGDQVPAVVISAPWSGKDVPVSLVLMGEEGVLGEARVTLTGAQPYAAVLSDLFPGVTLTPHLALLAETADDTLLTGTSFTFNRKGEPAMAKAIPVNQ